MINFTKVCVVNAIAGFLAYCLHHRYATKYNILKTKKTFKVLEKARFSTQLKTTQVYVACTNLLTETITDLTTEAHSLPQQIFDNSAAVSAFSALTLLVGHHEERPDCNN